MLEERKEQYIQSHPNLLDMGDMLYQQLQYVWAVQDRLSHRLYWLHDWDCGLVVWVCAADHLEDEEASRGGQRHDTRYEWRQDAAEHEISSHD